MKTHQAIYPIAPMCRVLGVSPSGYYAWRKRLPSARAQADALLKERIEAIHRRSRGTYGAPRIQAALAAQGQRVGRKRVAQLMQEAGLQDVSRRKKVHTTTRDDTPHTPDLVQRDFSAEAPDVLWVADITCTHLGWFPLPGRGVGRIQPAGHRLGHGCSFESGTGPGCIGHGPGAAAARDGDSPFGSWHAIHLYLLWTSVPRGRHSSLPRLGGRLL